MSSGRFDILIMARLTSEERVYIVKTFHKNGEKVLWKRSAELAVFSDYIIVQLRPRSIFFPEIWIDWFWMWRTRNVFVGAAEEKTLKLSKKMLPRIRTSRIVVVRRNVGFLNSVCSEFWGKICSCSPIKFNWCKNWSQMTIRSVMTSSIRWLNSNKLMWIFRTKSCSATNLISNSMATWISITVEFEALKTHVWFNKNLCIGIHNTFRFGADFGVAESLDRHCCQLYAVSRLRSMANATVRSELINEFLLPQLDDMHLDDMCSVHTKKLLPQFKRICILKTI